MTQLTILENLLIESNKPNPNNNKINEYKTLYNKAIKKEQKQNGLNNVLLKAIFSV